MSKCNPGLNFEKLISLFKALGDSNRMAIFQHICQCCKTGDQQANVKELSTCCDVDLSVVSRHLGTLKKAEVLLSEKKGKEVHYSLNGKELAESLRALADFIEDCNQRSLK